MTMHKTAVRSLGILAGVAMASTGFGDTLTWVGPYEYATGLYSNQWSIAENWQNEAGQHAVPTTGDSLVISSGCTTSGRYPSNDLKTYPRYKKLTLSGTTKQTIGGTSVCLQEGNEGIVQDCDLTAYFALSFPSGETLVTIASGKAFNSTENCSYAADSVIVKKGEGEFANRISTSAPKTVKIQEGVFGLKGNAGTVKGFKLIYDGPTANFYVYNTAVVLEDFDLEETENASASTHILRPQRYNVTTSMKFTGTPKSNPIVFTGQLTQNGIWEWAPTSDASEWVFSKGVSGFYGTLKVTNGKVTLKDNAAMKSVNTLAVGTGGTLNIEKGSYLVASSATIRGVTLGAGKMYRGSDGNVPGLTGGGWVVVKPGAKTGTDSEATWVGGVDSSLSTAGNWEGGAAPDLVQGGTRVIIAPKSGVSVSNLTFDGDLFLRGLDIRTDADISIKATSLTLSSASVSNVVTVGHSGTQQDVTLDVERLVMTADTKWYLGAGANVRVKGTIYNTKSIMAYGNGSIHCYKDVISNWLIAREKAGFILHGVTVMSDFNIDLDSKGNFLAAERGTTNLLTGTFCYYTDYTEWWINSKSSYGGLIVCEGGSLLHANMEAHNFRFDKKPIRNSMRLLLGGTDAGDLELNAPSNIIGCASAMISGGNALKTLCPDALVDWRTKLNGKSNCMPIIQFTGTGAIDLCGYNQSLAFMWANSANYGVVRSESAAQLRWNFDLDPYANLAGHNNLTSIITNSVAFTGGAGLTFAGAATEPFISTRLTASSSTTGTLEVVSGRLTLAENAAWANASNVKVSGGTLVCESAKNFRTLTTLDVSGNGTVDLAYTSRDMYLKSLKVDGVEFPKGIYGGPDSSAPVKPQINGRYIFSGTGRVHVGRVSLFVVFH